MDVRKVWTREKPDRTRGTILLVDAASRQLWRPLTSVTRPWRRWLCQQRLHTCFGLVAGCGPPSNTQHIRIKNGKKKNWTKKYIPDLGGLKQTFLVHVDGGTIHLQTVKCSTVVFAQFRTDSGAPAGLQRLQSSPADTHRIQGFEPFPTCEGFSVVQVQVVFV